jgi:predicted PurR-regulated permease PerM
MDQIGQTRDITRNTLAVLFIVGLIVGAYWIMRPFLPPLLWATMIVIATWPIMIRIQNRLGGSRKSAVIVMAFILVMILIIPLAYAVGTIFDSVGRITEWAESLQNLQVPPPPSWIAEIPLIGTKVSDTWAQFAYTSKENLVNYAIPYLPMVAEWFVSEAGSVGALIVEFLLTIIICTILYSKGETAAIGVRRFAATLSPDHGESVAILASKAIRGVALGVVVTALVQSFLAWLGLLVAGIPAAALLTAVIFILCLAQLPPTVVLIPAVIWLYWTGENFTATALLIWSIPVGFMDSFLRPVLIRKGADLPLLLVFAGVLGGLISLGIAGIFVGPTVLAVTFTLVKSWTNSTGKELNGPSENPTN